MKSNIFIPKRINVGYQNRSSQRKIMEWLA